MLRPKLRTWRIKSRPAFLVEDDEMFPGTVEGVLCFEEMDKDENLSPGEVLYLFIADQGSVDYVHEMDVFFDEARAIIHLNALLKNKAEEK